MLWSFGGSGYITSTSGYISHTGTHGNNLWMVAEGTVIENRRPNRCRATGSAWELDVTLNTCLKSKSFQDVIKWVRETEGER